MNNQNKYKKAWILIILCTIFQSKWVPRRGDNNPKTIEQIHQEAAKEAQDRAVNTQLALAQQKAAQKASEGK